MHVWLQYHYALLLVVNGIVNVIVNISVMDFRFLLVEGSWDGHSQPCQLQVSCWLYDENGRIRSDREGESPYSSNIRKT